MKQANYHKFIKIMLTSLLITVPAFIIPLGGFNDHFYYPKFMLLVVFAIVLLVYILVNVHDVVKQYKPSWADLFLVIYTLLMIIASLFARDFMDALYGRAYRHTGLIAHLIFVVLYFVSKLSGNLSKKSWLLIVISSALLAFYGLLQHFGFDPILRDNIRKEWMSAFSTFGNPNFAGSFYVMILPLSLYLVEQYGKKFYILYAWILFSLLLTFSTAAWIGGFVSLFVALSLVFIKDQNVRNKRNFILHTLSIGALVVVLFNGLTSNALFDEIGKTADEAVEVVENGNSNQQAGSGRIFIWSKTIELIIQRPWLGYGVENMAEAFSRYLDDMEDVFGFVITVDKAHNEYLQIAVDSGIPSMFVYLIFLVLLLIDSYKCVESRRDLLFILAAILGYLSQAVFSFSVISVSYLFWILLGFASSSTKIKRPL